MWDDWPGRVWAALWASDIKWTDTAIVLFTFGQVWIGIRQTRIARRQTEIADRTREIAIAALNRPYILVDQVSHNLSAWRDGRALLSFEFKIRNYGTSPAVMRHVVAYGFLSSGTPRTKRPDTYPAEIFPGADDIKDLLGDRPSVRIFPEVTPTVFDPETGKVGFQGKSATIILRPGEDSVPFRRSVKIDVSPPAEWFEGTGAPLANATPWLLGRIAYDGVSGQRHHTSFCFRGRSDGVAEEKGDAPYNERT
ncbi:hypothetical protein EAH89_29380 [Roseomonas nepalensis]|uniref:Uncharacterized protein n=1 Tax=Muricoccus nepalensis TaxID=1854500 RepID=A0A502ELD8_9PROT|nr:hypothetical protein [Roseomonas nepalensis]TPG38555.1 hypothetical protein EAH89_29380 [Roseomonas nepalensis]